MTTIDRYLHETLMRDLVSHSRSAAAFLIYLQLYCLTRGTERASVAMSHSVLAELTGLSKRSVQTAIGHLVERKLLRSHKARPTSVPVYTVLTPWIRRSRADGRGVAQDA
ncbi:MAG: helix-turn-helix domain-containing protein [Acidobacteria bacterium]|nr:helix-turn-helix domain-containing protein [Acidobacteriota bacterium]